MDGIRMESEIIRKNYLLFLLGGDSYGVDVMKSLEVVEVSDVRPLPDTREYMRGVIDLRGKVVPVIDLKRKMKTGNVASESSTVIILEVHGFLVGVVVDAVVDVVEIAGIDIQRTPHYTLDAEKDTVDGVAGVDDRMVVIIDAEKILDEWELKGLARSA